MKRYFDYGDTWRGSASLERIDRKTNARRERQEKRDNKHG